MSKETESPDTEVAAPSFKFRQREEVRSSMVVVLSKVLQVSENAAATQLKVLGALVVCCLLVLATFAVNIVSIDFSKDTKTQHNMVVDKSSGEPIDFHPKFSSYVPATCDFASLESMKEITFPLDDEDRMARFMISGVVTLVCPEESSPFCHSDGNLYVLTTFMGKSVYAIGVTGQDNQETVAYGVLSDDFLQLAFDKTTTSVTQHSERRLLAERSTSRTSRTSSSPPASSPLPARSSSPPPARSRSKPAKSSSR